MLHQDAVYIDLGGSRRAVDNRAIGENIVGFCYLYLYNFEYFCRLILSITLPHN